MELNNLNKLNHKTREDLIICELNLQNWLKFKSDYKALEERLSTISDKTTHDIMVPIGGSNLAFMPGFIKHTNEILVLLGDNYFVERSAKQAIDIVNRRLTNCDQMINSLNEEKSQLEKWLSFSEQFADEKKSEDMVEIVEEYDEQKEQLWREKHTIKVREYKQQLAKEKRITNQSNDDLELNHKFEQLETQELKPIENQFKSILKKETNTSAQSIKGVKSVSFDEIEDSVIITNEEECYPSPKFEPMMTNTNMNSESDAIECQRNEMPFKSDVKERIVDEIPDKPLSEFNTKIESAPKMVSRFKANRMKK